MLSTILGFSVLGSIGAVAGAALFLCLPEKVRTLLVPALISYATGTLLGAAFLGMLPAALDQAAPRTVTQTTLVGIVLFFLLEKAALWRHCHDDNCERHGRAGSLILIGDAFHNFVDGVVIAAAFLNSPALGVTTALAVVAHEAPQEIGDFAILLSSGYKRRKAFWLNSLSASTTIPGALVGYYWISAAGELLPYVLALSAASFLYIATADLIPELHHKFDAAASARQVSLLLAGIATIAWLHH